MTLKMEWFACSRCFTVRAVLSAFSSTSYTGSFATLIRNANRSGIFLEPQETTAAVSSAALEKRRAALWSCCLGGFVVIVRVSEAGVVRGEREDCRSGKSEGWDEVFEPWSEKVLLRSSWAGRERLRRALPALDPGRRESYTPAAHSTLCLHRIPHLLIRPAPAQALAAASLDCPAARLRAIPGHNCTLDFASPLLAPAAPWPPSLNRASDAANLGLVFCRRQPSPCWLPGHIFRASTLPAHRTRRAPLRADAFFCARFSAKMANKAAWITAKRAQPLHVSDAPKPKAGPGEVVVKNAAVAIVSFDTRPHVRDRLLLIEIRRTRSIGKSR